MADKAKQFVIINQSDFNTKFNNLIEELNARVLPADPTKTYINKVQTLVRANNKLAAPPFKFALPFYPAVPKLFVKIKTHKPDAPLRPIVSKCTSPTFNLEKQLSKFLLPLISDHPSNTKSGAHLIEELKNLTLPNTAKLVSFDIISMYPNIPLAEAFKLIIEKSALFEDIAPHIPFLEKALKLIFESNYFIFNGIVYQQDEGIPLGSPMATICSEIVLQKLESIVFRDLTLAPFFFRRYIDDMFIIWPFSNYALTNFLDKFNSVYPSINLTCEKERNKTLPFLDIQITRTSENKLYFNVYTKPTNKPLPIPASSYHPLSSKLAFFQAHINRAISYTTFQFHEDKIFKELIKIAKEAGFKPQIIETMIEKKINPIYSSQLHPQIKLVEGNRPENKIFKCNYVCSRICKGL